MHALFLAMVLGGCATVPQPNLETDAEKTRAQRLECPPEGKWVLANQSGALTTAELLDQLADARVVLLGERHDQPDDHRWQLHTLAALYGEHSDLRVGFEMFSRPQQNALDRWVQGHLRQEEFLEEVNWSQIWGFPAELYLPLLHFVRLNQVPAITLNIERELVRRIGQEGWEAVPPSERYHISAAAPRTPEYDELLDDILASHHRDPKDITEESKVRFRRAQSAWDRAMAQAIAKALERDSGPIVALVGRGHIERGYGIPHQLKTMGVKEVITLLPRNEGEPCLEDEPPLAQGLYGLPTMPAAPPDPTTSEENQH